MAHSTQLRSSDIQAIERLIHECRELWADPAAWRQHLVAGTGWLTGMAVVHYAEYAADSPGAAPRALCRADIGWRDDSARAIYLAAEAAHPFAFELFPGATRFVPRLAAGRAVVALRSDLCDDDTWYRSYVYNEFRRLAHNDDFAVSLIPRGKQAVAVLNVNQDVADSRPTERTKRQLALVHRLIEPLVATELATEEQRSTHGLSPQLRTTLGLLLEGKSEKRVAAELGLRPATVHEYVGKVYRHFGARSRAELMAYFIRRRPDWR